MIRPQQNLHYSYPGWQTKSEEILSKHSKVLQAESMLTKNDVTHKAAELLEDKESVALHWCNGSNRALQWETASQIMNSKDGTLNICLSIDVWITTSIPPTIEKLSSKSSMSELWRLLKRWYWKLFRNFSMVHSRKKMAKRLLRKKGNEWSNKQRNG